MNDMQDSVHPPLTGTRNQSVDLIKIIAMALVVCLHTARGAVCPECPQVSAVVYNLGVIAVPLFFMVSGYLLIGRQHVSFRYSWRKILAILRFVAVIVGFTWGIFYCLSIWSVKTLVLFFFSAFIVKGYFWFFWFFGSMILIYLLYPLINSLFSRRGLYLPALCTALMIQNCAFISNLVGNGETEIIQTFRLWNWLTYFMLGGAVRWLHPGRRSLWWGTGISAVATAAMMIWLYPHMRGSQCEYFYSSPAVVALTACVFMLVLSYDIEDSGFIRGCSALFLPVYALHPIIILNVEMYFYEYIFWLETFSAGCVVYWLTMLLASCLVSYILMKIPGVRRIFRL